MKVEIPMAEYLEKRFGPRAGGMQTQVSSVASSEMIMLFIAALLLTACAGTPRDTDSPPAESVRETEYALVVQNRGTRPLTLFYRLEGATDAPALPLGLVPPQSSIRFELPAIGEIPPQRHLLIVDSTGRQLTRVTLTAGEVLHVRLTPAVLPQRTIGEPSSP